ncbi:Protein O-linked-mannose beta-1,4-N-acetylglucosaminyltransferase 2 [Holothuria leucospilota]|uniref:Protein O-linked-mannose beta-1,4-N-acetylglucosaminyltransferase 2 n=1 Tax=Holothuria leucospilota TaxID=206669 RepID=A0A9Q0YQU4_HOLLE|nr:Protein O-linked-mannose beta-1,4-N-acetylglucosaminyltransferase 2 [Holothuria leucospilota]
MEWCKGNGGAIGETDARVCNFRNLCYSNFYKMFLLDKPVLVKHVVHLATVIGAGIGNMLSYYEIPMDNPVLKNHLYINYKRGNYAMFSRIPTNNIAHDIHDVLIPLFYTLESEEFNKRPSHTLIFWFEDLQIESATELYNLFSRDPPITDLQISFQPKETLTCFENVTVGLLTKSIWYQWGFLLEPEGPVRKANVTSQHIRKFTEYVKKHLRLAPRCTENVYGILFSRKINRKILNEKELASAIAENFHTKVVELSMESDTLPYIIETISCAKFALGIHGAMLILAMFLPPSSILLEMYPFGINPDHLTPYKTMAFLPGMNIEYVAWQNMNSSMSFFSKNSVRKIPRESLAEMKFRLYHDTIVNISEVLGILRTTSLVASSPEYPSKDL